MLHKTITLGLIATLSLTGCETVQNFFKDVDYDAIYNTADKVSARLVESAEKVQKTKQIAIAVQSLRGDYRAFKDAVKPYLSELSEADRARAIKIDSELVRLWGLAENVVETKVGGESIISALKASQLVVPARQSINDLIAIANNNRDLLNDNDSASLDALIGNWAVVDSLLSDIQAKGSGSVKVSKILKALKLASKAMPIALKVVAAVKK